MEINANCINNEVASETGKCRQICHIDMTLVTDGKSTDATGTISFDGTGSDVINTLVHIFYALELDPVEAYFLSQEAVRHFRDTYEEEEK